MPPVKEPIPEKLGGSLTPTAEQLRAAVAAHGRNAPAKIAKQFPSYGPAAIVAMLNTECKGWDQRVQVKHPLQAHPKPIGKGKAPKPKSED